MKKRYRVTWHWNNLRNIIIRVFILMYLMNFFCFIECSTILYSFPFASLFLASRSDIINHRLQDKNRKFLSQVLLLKLFSNISVYTSKSNLYAQDWKKWTFPCSKLSPDIFWQEVVRFKVSVGSIDEISDCLQIKPFISEN